MNITVLTVLVLGGFNCVLLSSS